MPGTPVEIGPWKGGLKNVAGFGEFIDDEQCFGLENLEVDVDGSLVNRPAVLRQDITGISAQLDDAQILTSHVMQSGTRVVVLATSTITYVINVNTGTVVASHTITQPRAAVVYNSSIYIIPSNPGTGGFFQQVDPNVDTFSWVGDNMPAGVSAAVYKDRLFIMGINSSTVRYSDVADFSTWDTLNNFEVGHEAAQQGRAIVRLGDDLIIFLSNSTYRYGYASDPGKADLKLVDSSIGTISENCVTVYRNGTIYVLHGNTVYEYYQNQYTRLSDDVDMTRDLDPVLFSGHIYGISVFKDRLFVRFHKKMYVLSLITQRWSEWITGRRFSTVTVVTQQDPNDDLAYMVPALEIGAGRYLYYMNDSRIIGVATETADPVAGTSEVFVCKIITKSYDFAAPTYFKAILMGGLAIATSGYTTVKAVVPGSAYNIAPTWGQWYSEYSWQTAYELLTWGQEQTSDGDIIAQKTTAPDSTPFGRKLIKCLGKFRYRQVQFIMEVPAVFNTSANFAVRIFNLTVYAIQKETVVKEVS